MGGPERTGILASSVGSLHCSITATATALAAVVATAVVSLRLGDRVLAAGASHTGQLPVHFEERRP